MVMRKDLAEAMNVRIVGSSTAGKETIVLAHGFGGDQSIWDKILPYLCAHHYQVVLFDWCFSGAVKDPTLYDPARYSSYDAFADDLIYVMDEMKLNSSSSSSSSSSVVFVGHSMSAIIGCIASIKRPHLFRKLLLVGPSPRFINEDEYEGGFHMSEIEDMFSSIESNFEAWASSFASVVIDSSDPVSIRKFESCLKRMRGEVALALAKIVFLSDYRDILENVVTPCHIIQTRNDTAVPSSVPKYMQSKISGKCTLDIIETNGHFPQLTAHIQFVELILTILTS
ncbi:hypothetical protein BUALT_Bualt12G0094600 [Buddleja alternifolia]|uniref:AB hydrolase-1 domain-containing protein n=1 Tax=Buddleja alternifolia TaxID=168488 RepID=A0AAV6WX69_9LAMI|nr:hypothetical protein BUALT_Bualt12G0094600 [Buddleja alternifolia]